MLKAIPYISGKIAQGQEIAVKRLSQRSGQGVKEFMNEVTLISKLQHRNLVRLLDVAYKETNSTKRTLLDWTKRVSIIEGTAQGLLYLHSGYMAPEYAMDGLFSEKPDAWNCGRKTPLELLDSTVANSSCSASEVVRCLQLGLLCVQERAADRPCMSDVISMLRNDTIVLPLPKEPAFLAQFTSGTDSHSSRNQNRDHSEMK
nr:putative receptor-like protein kinase At4g00960 [Coffea arabica]